MSDSSSRAAGIFSVFKKDSKDVSEELNAVYKSATATGKALAGIGAAGALGTFVAFAKAATRLISFSKLAAALTVAPIPSAPAAPIPANAFPVAVADL